MSLQGAVYEVELSNINDGQRLIFNVATDNIARYVREWNAECRYVSKIVKVNHIVSHVRIFDYEEQDKLKELQSVVNHG